MNHDLFSTIINGLGFSPETVEQLKEDGHSYPFEFEYQTPSEEAGITIEGDNKWLTLMKKSVQHQKANQN
jgi:hypothetical protein